MLTPVKVYSIILVMFENDSFSRHCLLVSLDWIGVKARFLWTEGSYPGVREIEARNPRAVGLNPFWKAGFVRGKCQ